MIQNLNIQGTIIPEGWEGAIKVRSEDGNRLCSNPCADNLRGLPESTIARLNMKNVGA